MARSYFRKTFFQSASIVLSALLFATMLQAKSDDKYLSLTAEHQAVIFNSADGLMLVAIFPPKFNSFSQVLYYMGKPPSEFKQLIIEKIKSVSLNNDQRVTFRGGIEMELHPIDVKEGGDGSAYLRINKESEPIKFLNSTDQISGSDLNALKYLFPIDESLRAHPPSTFERIKKSWDNLF